MSLGNVSTEYLLITILINNNLNAMLAIGNSYVARYADIKYFLLTRVAGNDIEI